MLPLTRLRRLDVLTADGRPGFVSAASGLVAVGDFLHVIADDELTIASFQRSKPTEPGTLLTLLPGQLPDKKKARKREKPDWEALLLLPANPGFPQGALMGFGSGSKPERARAVVIGLNHNGDLAGEVTTYSLAPFYDAVARKLDELNVEAVFLAAGRIHFVSRGNRTHPISTVIACDGQAWFEWLSDPSRPTPAMTLTSINLPSLNDVVAGVSDAVALTSGWLATAIAEATDDSYNDGACVGAAIARFDERHRMIGWWPLVEPVKVEGLIIAGAELLLVNDPDDPKVPAELFSCPLPG